MDVQALLYVLPVFFVPIAVDLAVGELRGKPRYRMNDLLTNLTLSLLVVLGGVAVTGGTLWVYTSVYQAHPRLPLTADAMETWVLAFLSYDFLYYWAHRAHHRISCLWGVHVVHHSGEDMNFGLAVRNSAFGEATFWVFFLPMALMGIPPSVYLGVTLVQIVFQYTVHNTYVPQLGWLERVLVTPSQHRVHHGRNRLYIDKNYGNVLVIWDRLFGTYQPELPEQPAVYGLRRSIRTLNPFTIHLDVFIDLFRKAVACRRARDKVLCALMPPGWEPPSLDRSRCPGRPDDGPSASFRKYDPSMRAGGAPYCLAQFVALASGIVLLLMNLPALSAAGVAVSCGLILLTAWTLGGFLDGIPLYWRREPGRLAAVAVLGTGVIWYDGLPVGQSLFPLALYLLASAGYLLWYQTDLLQSAFRVVTGTRFLSRDNPRPLIPSAPRGRALPIAVTHPRTFAASLTASRPIELCWVSTIADIAPTDWDTCFPHGDAMQSYALHHATEAASLRGVEFHYLVARRAEEVVAIVPCFRFRMSLVVVAPPTVQRAVAGIRRFLPGFLYLRGLVVGTPIAICKDLLGLHPSLQDGTRDDVLRAVLGEVVARASQLRLGFVLIKELTTGLLPHVEHVIEERFTLVESAATTYLYLGEPGHGTYRERLRHKYRSLMNKRQGRFAAAGFRWQAVTDFSRYAKSMHALYLQVLDRSKIHFETLSVEFFEKLPSFLGDQAFALLCFKGERPVAFELFLKDEQWMHPIYLGLDYQFRDEAALYFNCVYRIIETLEAHGKPVVQLGQTSYAVKASLGAVVDRLYLALHHTHPVFNLLLKRFAPVLFPPTEIPRSQRVFRDMGDNDRRLARHGIRFDRR